MKVEIKEFGKNVHLFFSVQKVPASLQKFLLAKGFKKIAFDKKFGWSTSDLSFDKVVALLKAKEWQKTIVVKSVGKPIKRGLVITHKQKTSQKKQATKQPKGLAGTMSIAELSNRPFKPYTMPEIWQEVIGNFELPIQILVYGKGGRGKSGMALSFANDFSKGGKKVLYASKEQYYNPTLPHLIRAVGIDVNNPNITIAPEFITQNYNPSMFDLVVLDSKDSFGLKDPEEFEKLVHKYPKTSFMLLSQSTKDDEFRGAGNWQNVIDTMLHVHQKGKMKTGEKNRWGASGEITLFETNQQDT